VFRPGRTFVGFQADHVRLDSHRVFPVLHSVRAHVRLHEALRTQYNRRAGASMASARSSRCRSAMSWGAVVQQKLRRQCGVLDTIPAKITARLFLASRAWITRVSCSRAT
jgi:hypothetical protein